MKNKKLCSKCKVFLKKTYVGDYSKKWNYCVSCPKCHIVYDLISKGQEKLTKQNNSSKKDCLSCTGCQLFKLTKKDHSKNCEYYTKRSPS